MLNVAIFQILF